MTIIAWCHPQLSSVVLSEPFVHVCKEISNYVKCRLYSTTLPNGLYMSRHASIVTPCGLGSVVE